MKRLEFDRLRALPGKEINQDIAFERPSGSSKPYEFRGVVIDNGINCPVFLNGHYDPRIPKIGFNFTVQGVGPICRLDINGTVHKDVGRNHKHELVTELDPINNLPTAVRRDDLATLDVYQAWAQLCLEANITHRGKLYVKP